MAVQHDGVAADERVVDEALHLHGPETDAAHVRVAWHVVEVVDGCRPAQDRFQRAQPPGWRVPFDVCVGHDPRHPHRIDALAGSEGSVGTRAQSCDVLGELMCDQVTTDHLVVDVPLREHLVVEEVTKRSVAGIVQQACQAERLLDERG